MRKKKQKVISSRGKGERKKKERLCTSGFKLEPRCGLFHIKFDLRKNPMLRYFIGQDVFPPYSYEYIDADTVIMDQCLICHMKKGISPEEYEKKNEAYGITRSNWEHIKPSLEAVMDNVAQEIRDTRKELINEQGLSFEMPYQDHYRDC